MSAISRSPFFRYKLEYTFFDDGTMKVNFSGKKREDCIWLPRLGFEFKTLYENDKFTYFGRGDGENYCDMKYHAKVGFYESDADSEYVNYIVPQEHGNHYAVRYLKLDNGLTFVSDKAFEINVSQYSAEELFRAQHEAELRKDGKAHVRVDYKDSGIGSGSCGPELMEQYQLKEEDIHFEFILKA